MPVGWAIMWPKRKDVPSGIPQKIIDRVAMLHTPDLVQWADQAIYTTGRSLTSHIREPSADLLAEALTGARVLLAITEEIARRTR